MPAIPQMIGKPPPLKASGGSVVHELLHRLEGGKVSVDQLLVSLDDEIDREAHQRAMQQPLPLAMPARLASRYLGAGSTAMQQTSRQDDYVEPDDKCSRCAVLELQVRSLTQSLLGLCTHFTNQVLANAVDAAARQGLLDMALAYLQPFAHIDEAIAEACLGLRTAVGTVGAPPPMPTVPVGPVRLKLCIVGAKGLRNVNRDGSSDPYCVCTVPGKPELTFTTQFVGATSKPTWNYEVEFEYQHGDSLQFQIFHHNETFQEVLGETILGPLEFTPLGFDGDVKLTNTGWQVGSAVLNIKVELPCSNKCLAWPPTVEGLVDRLVQTQARLADAEKQGFVDSTTRSVLLTSSRDAEKLKKGGLQKVDPGDYKVKKEDLQKVDPDDYKVYTLKELGVKYKGKFSTKQVKKYWENACMLLDVESSAAYVQTQSDDAAFHFASPPEFANTADYERIPQKPLRAVNNSDEMWF